MKKPRLIVFSGGGTKGLANEAALKVLDYQGMLSDVEVVIGSSVGGLTAAMLALGYDMVSISHFIRTGGDGLLDLTNKSPLFDQFKSYRTGRVIKNLVKDFSISKGYVLHEMSQAVVGRQLNNPNATFSDLRRKHGTLNGNGKFRDLELTVTVSDPRGNYQIVCSAETTPNMPIALAMRMTSGIPPVFPSIKITKSEMEKYTVGATAPLVKYDRGIHFSKNEFNSDVFYNLSQDKQQEIIEEINDDIFKHSFQNGVLRCADGGIVDNLPVYLAKAHKDVSFEDIIAFTFEEPWRKENREAASALYDKERTITPQDEIDYHERILNISENDRLYYIFQNYIYQSRLPPSHHLELLKRSNLLCLETGDISSTDFDPTPDQRKYLLEKGFEAAHYYVAAREKPLPSGMFEHFFPEYDLGHDSLESEVHTQPCLREQITSLTKRVDHFFDPENTMQETEMIEYYRDVRSALKNAKEELIGSEHSQLENNLLLKDFRNMTDQHFSDLFFTNKECKRKLSEALRQLSLAELVIYKMVKKNPSIAQKVKNTDPVFFERLNELSELRRRSRTLSRAIKTFRAKDISFSASLKPIKTNRDTIDEPTENNVEKTSKKRPE